MKTIVYKLFLTILLLSSHTGWSQIRTATDTTKVGVSISSSSDTEVEFERPLNFFASAGVSYRLYGLNSVVVSPIDNTVQIEEVSRLNSRISFGLVWNPLTNDATRIRAIRFKNKFADQIIAQSIQAARENFAFALLINVYQLSFSQNQTPATSPIDVGFGVGYRSKNLLIMGTIDFTPYRDPRQYFLDTYKGKNKTLVYAGSQGPVTSINIDDNSIFETRLHAFIGFKVAYAFTNNEKKAVAAPKE